MHGNKLYNLIDKYNLTNKIKVLLFLLILFLFYRIFIEPQIILNEKTKMTNIYEGFETTIGNGDIYGNVITLKNQSTIPEYSKNTCIFKLSNVYRIDTLIFMFNSPQNITISFLDGNGNTKYIKNPNTNESPPIFNTTGIDNSDQIKILLITDENNLAVYTSQIMLKTTDNTFTSEILNSFGIYGGDRNLNSLSTYDNLANSLFVSPPLLAVTSSVPASINAGQVSTSNTVFKINTDITTLNQDYMIYSLKLVFLFDPIISNTLTESCFNIKITYENSLYLNNIFTINTIYKIRNDKYILHNDKHKSFIFLTEPIIANTIIFTVSSVSTTETPPIIINLNFASLNCLYKYPSATDKSDYQKTVNLLKSSENDTSNDKCPSINDLVVTQKKTQQLCDNMEFQDKVKSEKIRLERNKQYLLKLKDQQTQIDTLNTVIQDLEDKREARSQTSDQVRVLQYQKQKADSSTIRDLANQRLESQAHNQLYMDININKQ